MPGSYWEEQWELLWGGDGDLTWGERASGDHNDLESPLIPIPIGLLNIEATATERIWKQYEGNPIWLELIGIIGSVFADIEAGLAAVDQAHRFGEAVGVQLEEIGAAVGRSRGGLDADSDYRTAILVDAATLYSSGTLPEVIELATALAGSAAEVAEFYPAAFRLRIPDLSAERFALLLSVLDDVPAAGVAALLSTYGSAETGGWSSISGATSTPAAWSSVYGPVSNPRAHWASARGVGA